MGSGTLDRDEVEDVLLAAAEVCDLPDAEAAGVICWGLDRGADDPLELDAHVSAQHKPRSRRSRIYARMRTAL